MIVLIVFILYLIDQRGKQNKMSKKLKKEEKLFHLKNGLIPTASHQVVFRCYINIMFLLVFFFFLYVHHAVEQNTKFCIYRKALPET